MKIVLISAIMMCACLFPLERASAEWDSAFFVADGLTLADAKEDFDFASWGGSTKTAYVHTVTNWVVDLELGGVSEIDVRSGVVWSNPAAVGRLCRYTFQHANTPTNVSYAWRLMTIETPSVLNAQEMMIARFTQLSVGDVVAGNSVNIDVGDKCYVLETTPEWKQYVAFCRNNIFVELGAWATNGYDGCVGIAGEIDRQILSASQSE